VVENSSMKFKDILLNPFYFLETFVDTEHSYETCYKATNWKYLDDTTGRGKDKVPEADTFH